MRFLLPILAATSLLAQTAHPAPKVQEGPLRAHLAFLADDLLEGRGTGQRGAELTVRYLETQLQSLGLRPGNGASYRQPVSLLGLKALPGRSTLSFLGGGACATPTFGSEIVFGSGVAQAEQTFDAPVVFAGFGIDAPEWRWDDYKGLDLRGKVLLMLVNEPAPTAEEPGLFDGANLSAYGRWTKKFEMAAQHGALGVLLVHTPASATYGWTVVRPSWEAERFSLAQGPRGTGLQGWVTEEVAKALAKQGGQDLDALRAQAQRRDFRPLALDLRLQGTLRSEVRTVAQFNVAGVVPGTDPVLKEELVVYSAHWDHLGKGPGLAVDTHAPAVPGHEADTIYNGAIDNASGCAALLAMAQAARHAPAKRSQMFLFVCAEEQGLLGSRAYAEAPLWPLAKTAADLNLDSLNFVAPTRDIGLPFRERSTLGEVAEAVARASNLTVAPTHPDTGGGYFRSDHYSFVQAGVPALSVGGGRDFLGADPAALKAKASAYGKRYHQVTDEYDPAWDLRGMVQQAQFTFDLGQAVANAPTRPTFKTVK
ncbi:MAG: M28 family peptidase [Geothrix sp.]|uniref:M28 family peptidase n=1 Tax=Geothrix sp. TaxID=1962974 RepID=UPI0018508132|nr:M28 family peptidase [Geothrix sp.]NWJ41295.1 M28 family peptidase [Geothrix sp.]WIL20715.1 MAG: M28 family peptidase [Geothrix sp.]